MCIHCLIQYKEEYGSALTKSGPESEFFFFSLPNKASYVCVRADSWRGSVCEEPGLARGGLHALKNRAAKWGVFF